MKELKKIKGIFIFLMCVVFGSGLQMNVEAEEGKYNGFIYQYATHYYYEDISYEGGEYDDYAVLYKELIIVDYVGTDSEVIIPAEIDGKKVTKVSAGCFAFNTKIQKVVFESPYTTLEEGVFMGCKNLKKVILPDEIEFIPEGTFAYCSNLTEIRIPDNGVTLGEEAFYKCVKLKRVKVGEDGKEIYERIAVGESAFEGCRSLEDICFEKITVIAEDAFRGCKSLKEADINAYHLGDGAFAYCTGLKKVIIEYGWDNKKNKNIFLGCKKLKEIIFRRDLPKKIYPGTFKGIHKKAVFRVIWDDTEKLKRMLTKKVGFRKTMKVTD